jgi:Ca2+/Na+ antiporter
VVASLARGRSSLALGNIIGAAVSNILGAFSLGLLFYEKGKPIEFDRSSRIYSIVLLVLTTFITPITYFSRKSIWLVCGALLIVTFGVYVISVGFAISRGVLTAPEASDGESSDDDSSNDGSSTSTVDVTLWRSMSPDRIEILPNDQALTNSDEEEHPTIDTVPAAAPAALTPTAAPPSRARRRKQHNLRYHVFYLFLGFLAICLAGYVLSQAATNIIDQFGISDVLFGVIILAIATTLPEKFVAVMSGSRGHTGILVANTVGSNIFLLSLCAGIIMVDTKGTLDAGNVTIPELAVLWASTLGFVFTVWFGGKFCRWIGAMMLACYIAFIVCEFTVIHRIAD